MLLADIANSQEQDMAEQGRRALVRLRQMIMAGELKPGSRVAEVPIAAQLGVSRMPVRMALPVLEQEGLP